MNQNRGSVVRWNCNGGQKCWDLSSDITKTSDPSPPTPNKVEFGAKWVRMSAFLATTLLGEVGERRDEPKAEQKIVLRSRVLRNNCLEGLFHTVPSSFVLHCRIVSLSLVIREFIISNHNGDSKENVN